MSSTLKKVLSLHYKCRQSVYPRSQVNRFPVPDDKVPWSVEWPDYQPEEYTSDHILNQEWSDPDILCPEFTPSWNMLDKLINRQSHFCKYDIINERPINPYGRTGLTGRGCLGRWGPNHAADPIVTRWKRTDENEIVKNSETDKPILQFVGIQRKDSGEWAIPGGMVDAGEVVTSALKREFLEEALNVLESSGDEKLEKEAIVNDFFTNGIEVYKGYVDDPRNTDNSWMETVALNFHDEENTSAGKFPLTAGDDAVNVCWMDVSSSLTLYASHIEFIKIVADNHQAHW